ncbi:MAG: 1-deoxy-D-xylulose-5-phosphate reductoisomerase [Alphaproteobacteria bacterium]
MTRVTLLGATGSVGRQTADVMLRHPDRFSAVAVTANRDVDGLAALAVRLGAEMAAVADPGRYDALRQALAGTGIAVAAGPAGLEEAAARESDFVMAAIVGAAGLAPTLTAIRRGARIGLANKECLVCAGDLMLAEAQASGALLLPTDSEHNAIFQVLDSRRPEAIERLILTASGGPFRNRPRETLTDVTPAEAVAHPNWSMGAKISVDSATMMNKGLETIEAFHLFPVAKSQIAVLMHPESIVHSMVCYVDGSVLAQLGAPDMRIPIAYCLAWPERVDTAAARLDLAAIGALHFAEPDDAQFPALALARQALAAGGSAPNVLNAANEVAVAAFLDGALPYLAITDVVASVLDDVAPPPPAGLDDVLAADRSARLRATQVVKRRADRVM